MFINTATISIAVPLANDRQLTWSDTRNQKEQAVKINTTEQE